MRTDIHRRGGARREIEPEPPLLVDRKNETRRLEEAIRKRTSLVISGPAGMGKTALVRSVIQHLPVELASRCIYLPGVTDLQNFLRQLVRKLFFLRDPSLRRQLHAEGITVLNFEAWLRTQSSSRLRGCLYRAVDGEDYYVFLDHFPALTRPVGKVIKELSWMRRTPTYLLTRNEADEHRDHCYAGIYRDDRERMVLSPLPRAAAEELLERCIERYGLVRFDLAGFSGEVLALSKQCPGAIVEMCTLSADPRYQQGSRIKTKSVYIDYLVRGSRGNGLG